MIQHAVIRHIEKQKHILVFNNSKNTHLQIIGQIKHFRYDLIVGMDYLLFRSISEAKLNLFRLVIAMVRSQSNSSVAVICVCHLSCSTYAHSSFQLH